MLTSRLLRRRAARPSPDAMSVSEHLGEVRRRLLVCLVALAIASLVAFYAYGEILHVLLEPLCRLDGTAGGRESVRSTPAGSSSAGCALYVTSPLDGLSLRIRITMFGGFALASPVLLFELWRFITPGLRRSERRYAVPFVMAATVLFLAGAATAYWILPHALAFLQEIGGPGLKAIYDPISYLSLVTLMMLLFGLAFQFPSILVSLELAHAVTSAQLLHAWRWAVLGIVIVAGVFVPSSDPFSMLALAVPLVVFYFAAIGIGRVLKR